MACRVISTANSGLPMTYCTAFRSWPTTRRPPWVPRAEQHEAARAGHRLDPGPDRRRVDALGERLVDVRLETTETLLERGLHVGEGPI
jgi:hypothetical protein